MPHYDESFIHDDNQNQKRNKRSYHVYKHGSSPLSLLERGDVLTALEERGTSVIKRNIRNIKERGVRAKASPSHYANCRGPDIIIDHCPRVNYYDPEQYYDIRNNNVSLVPCKSLDNLTLKQKKNKDRVIRSGTSLQSLVDEERLQKYASPSGYENGMAQRGDGRSYCFSEVRRRPMPRRLSRGFTAPGVGVYRQICSEASNTTKTINGMNFNDFFKIVFNRISKCVPNNLDLHYNMQHLKKSPVLECCAFSDMSNRQTMTDCTCDILTLLSIALIKQVSVVFDSNCYSYW